MSKRVKTPINERSLLNAQEAADYLSVSANTLRDWFKDGELERVPIGESKFRYRRLDLENLIDRLVAGETNTQKKMAQ